LLRPVLKQSVPYVVADGGVHFRCAGVMTSLDDPDGRVLALLRLLDGQHGPDQVYRDLRADYPDVTADEVTQALADLDESGLIQDATDTGSDFDAEELQRWDRNFGFWETYASTSVSKYEFQRRIRECKIAVLGIGGVGSHVLLDLIGIGFTDIRIVDFDRIELSNLNRQVLYGTPFLGQPKAEIAAERARAFGGKLNLEVVQQRLLSADDVYAVVHDRDLVLGTADAPKLDMMHWLSQGCVRAGAALITGGVATQLAYMYSVVPGISGCSDCWFESVQRSDPASRMLHREMRAAEARGERFGEDTAAFNGLVVLLDAYMVGDAVRLASQVSPPVSVGRVLEVTFQDPLIRVAETFSRLPDCPVCRSATAPEWLRWLSDDDRPLPF
jgi:molybdopterin/thiamine biosynthesis adenylyltransferase